MKKFKNKLDAYLKITLKKNATFLCDIVFVDEKFHKKIAKCSLNMLEI